jgi:hypothetical protein
MLGEKGVNFCWFHRDELRKIAERIGAPTLDKVSHPIDARPTHTDTSRGDRWLTNCGSTGSR